MRHDTITEIADTPAEGFEFYELMTAWAERVRERTHVVRHDSGDWLTLEADYVQPEGRRVAVDAYVPTHESLTVVIPFDVEVPSE